MIFSATPVKKRRRRQGVSATILLAAGLLYPAAAKPFAELTLRTEQSFNRYITLSEARILEDFSFPPDLKTRLRTGETLVAARKTLTGGKEIKPPDGMIQDWEGQSFLPGATLAGVRRVMQSYGDYPSLFGPEIIGARVLSHKDDRFEVFLRMFKKQILTVVFNATFDVTYRQPSATYLAIDSRSVRIAQVKKPKPPYSEEETPGHDAGYLWHLNSYWHFEEGDGGVYARCEAISLSRDVPFALGWALRGFIEKFPKESMLSTLAALKRATPR